MMDVSTRPTPTARASSRSPSSRHQGGRPRPHAARDQRLEQVDVDGSGYVEYSEFAALLRDPHEDPARGVRPRRGCPPSSRRGSTRSSQNTTPRRAACCRWRCCATGQDGRPRADAAADPHGARRGGERRRPRQLRHLPTASSVIYKLLDPKMMKERKAASPAPPPLPSTVRPSPRPAARSSPASILPLTPSRRPPSAGLSEDELAQQLMAAFVERDSVGAGTLPVAELRGALSSWQTGTAAARRTWSR